MKYGTHTDDPGYGFDHGHDHVDRGHSPGRGHDDHPCGESSRDCCDEARGTDHGEGIDEGFAPDHDQSRSATRPREEYEPTA